VVSDLIAGEGRAFQESTERCNAMLTHSLASGAASRVHFALLANPSQSVAEVAVVLGFSETSWFSTAFRQATGTTPTVYRRTL
jgi:transcriptional regulator GlxA family with amidase domain